MAQLVARLVAPLVVQLVARLVTQLVARLVVRLVARLVAQLVARLVAQLVARLVVLPLQHLFFFVADPPPVHASPSDTCRLFILEISHNTKINDCSYEQYMN